MMMVLVTLHIHAFNFYAHPVAAMSEHIARICRRIPQDCSCSCRHLGWVGIRGTSSKKFLLLSNLCIPLRNHIAGLAGIQGLRSWPTAQIIKRLSSWARPYAVVQPNLNYVGSMTWDASNTFTMLISFENLCNGGRWHLSCRNSHRSCRNR